MSDSQLSQTPSPRAGRARRRTVAALAAAVLAVLALCAVASASASPSRTAFRAQRLCANPPPGFASCQVLRLIGASITKAQLRSSAIRQAREAAHGASPAVVNSSPISGGLTPQSLHAAYSLPSETVASSTQTVAVVDAYNDPTAEADLGVYDKQFGLSACTTANGCFHKINQLGRASPLPSTQGEWSTEISLDVQMAHAICQTCHVLLVEANSAGYADLGTAVNAAVTAGATEISNSYGGPESSYFTNYNAPYNHPGVVITASSGDCGHFNEACQSGNAANFPADSPDVVAVGGTTLSGSGENWSSTAWSDGGSGCSQVFTAPLWQASASNFSATGCASGRSVADVAAVGDPYTGVDVYDSTPAGNGDATGWGVWGGTSAASPIIAAEFGLAGGAHGVEYPAATLYSNLGNGSALYDVSSGSNGSCSNTTSCRAAVGFDGPSGVGSPLGLSAFAAAASPSISTRPSVSGVAEQGQSLTLTHGAWTNSPTSFSDRWVRCNSSGSGCAAIAGASTSTYTATSTDIGSTIRLQEIASNASGASVPSVSDQTGSVLSNAPVITSFTPSSGAAGGSVTITGTALNGTSRVRFGSLSATFAVVSSTQVTSTVPNGAGAATISLTTPVKSATSHAKFTPTHSLTAFSPTSGAPGKLVTITGIGFTSSSTVKFNGVAAKSVTFVSSTKLKATVPAEAGSGPITVTNTAAPVGTVTSAASFAAG
jgi:IPT/TIG domain